MAGFDHSGIFFSDNFVDNNFEYENEFNRASIKKKFKMFIREFHINNLFIYREMLRRNYNSRRYWIDIELRHLSDYDDNLCDHLKKQPTELLSLFEEAAKEVADEITRPRPDDEIDMHDIQIMLMYDAHPLHLRHLKSEYVSKLIKTVGIVIAASSIRTKASHIAIQCRSCRNIISNIKVKPGLEGYALPRKCNSITQPGQPSCQLDPYFVMPDKCQCIDFQILKLQEAPEFVLHGEMPKHIQLYCDRNLVDRAMPGNKITLVGIYCIKRNVSMSKMQGKEKLNIGTRQPYVRVLGIRIDTNGIGRSSAQTLTTSEEEEFIHFSHTSNIYDVISNSIAPSIYGANDIKKAIACLLFGGSRKRLPDGLFRRGDINVLLVGDPGTAKSQLLKFIEKVAPIGVYTSGKGSSAAGLTASVIRDPNSKNFVIEGGAMVLADGGVVCIDEFDKMREDDRVAIHEAMEQQTISIAKAGITTTLNSRCSVLAAANSIYGRWDDLKGDDNLDFMPTILSRFDMIFIIKDEHDEKRDTTLAKHVIKIHMNILNTDDNTGDMSIQKLKKYIAYCRSKCGPRLSESASEKLRNQYVVMRNGTSIYEREIGKKTAIPITVRQLEALIRIAESLAKMRLAPFADEGDVDEALRLFHVSTLSSAGSGNLAGIEGFTTPEDQKEIARIEKQIRRRFVIGSQVSEYAIVQDFIQQNYSERAIYKVLHAMVRRGDVQYRMQRKVLIRVR
ncbi:unnamed protein product [Rotaria sp. Silwood1]|nr:unnamed protein product [Rotaria sp. Silwood1]CAF1253534.1 unnamed protein product [Rotaria sp. Silwood1]